MEQFSKKSGINVATNDLGLTTGTVECLEGLGISMLGQLISWSAVDLLNHKLGRMSLKEIEEVLVARGLGLRQS